MQIKAVMNIQSREECRQRVANKDGSAMGVQTGIRLLDVRDLVRADLISLTARRTSVSGSVIRLFLYVLVVQTLQCARHRV